MTFWVISAKEIQTLRVHLKGVVVSRRGKQLKLNEKNMDKANVGGELGVGVYPCFFGVSTARHAISEAFRAPLGVEFLSLS